MLVGSHWVPYRSCRSRSRRSLKPTARTSSTFLSISVAARRIIFYCKIYAAFKNLCTTEFFIFFISKQLGISKFLHTRGPLLVNFGKMSIYDDSRTLCVLCTKKILSEVFSMKECLHSFLIWAVGHQISIYNDYTFVTYSFWLKVHLASTCLLKNLLIGVT